MGTTIVTVAIFDNQVVVYNIGDSSAYGLTKDNVMNVVTVEDSFVGALISAGVITEEEAKSQSRKTCVNTSVSY